MRDDDVHSHQYQSSWLPALPLQLIVVIFLLLLLLLLVFVNLLLPRRANFYEGKAFLNNAARSHALQKQKKNNTHICTYSSKHTNTHVHIHMHTYVCTAEAAAAAAAACCKMKAPEAAAAATTLHTKHKLTTQNSKQNSQIFYR